MDKVKVNYAEGSNWFKDAGVPMPTNESMDDLGLDTVEELKLFAPSVGQGG